MTNADLPPGSLFHLTTDFFQFIIPQMYALYPDRNMTGYINAIAPPVTYFDAGGNIVINVTGARAHTRVCFQRWWSAQRRGHSCSMPMATA